MDDWLFDLGNSRLKCAPLDADGRMGEVVAIAHEAGAFDAPQFEVLPEVIGHAYLASVASAPLCEALQRELQARGAHVHRVRTEARCGGMTIAYDTPAHLGVDRFLALLAAHARGGEQLVVGVGTALTIDLLAASGRHHGGRIAPSPTLMRESLHARAAHLPATGGDYQAFAGDTTDALASGCLGAALALIEDSRREAEQVLGRAPDLLMHGGGAAELMPHLREARLVPDLVLEGLARRVRVQAADTP